MTFLIDTLVAATAAGGVERRRWQGNHRSMTVGFYVGIQMILQRNVMQSVETCFRDPPCCPRSRPSLLVGSAGFARVGRAVSDMILTSSDGLAWKGSELTVVVYDVPAVVEPGLAVMYGGRTVIYHGLPSTSVHAPVTPLPHHMGLQLLCFNSVIMSLRRRISCRPS